MMCQQEQSKLAAVMVLLEYLTDTAVAPLQRQFVELSEPYCSNVRLFQFVMFNGVQGAGPVPWVGGPLGASFRFYLREAFQSQTHTGKISHNESR